jgi:hypothetical protein
LLTEAVCVVVPVRRIVIITAYEFQVLTRAPKRPPGGPDTGDECEGDDDDGSL